MGLVAKSAFGFFVPVAQVFFGGPYDREYWQYWIRQLDHSDGASRLVAASRRPYCQTVNLEQLIGYLVCASPSQDVPGHRGNS